MRLRNLRKRDATEFETCVEVDEVEFEVTVHYETQPPEPDVNVAGGTEINSVITQAGEDITDKLSEGQLESLAMDIDEYNVSAWEAAQEDYGRDY